MLRVQCNAAVLSGARNAGKDEGSCRSCTRWAAETPWSRHMVQPQSRTLSDARLSLPPTTSHAPFLKSPHSAPISHVNIDNYSKAHAGYAPIKPPRPISLSTLFRPFCRCGVRILGWRNRPSADYGRRRYRQHIPAPSALIPLLGCRWPPISPPRQRRASSLQELGTYTGRQLTHRRRFR